jgi:type II secretory pathway component PulF
MNYFKYKVLRADGQVSGGVVQLPFFSEPAAQEYFERRGGTVLSVTQVGALFGQLLALSESRISRRIKRDNLIEFLNNLSIMLRSGIPVLAALTESISLSENKALIRTVEHVHLSIEAGLSFSDSLDQHPQIFPETVRYLARIGEEAGTLDRTLKDSAKHLERLRQIKSDTSRSMIYPLFVLLTTFFAGWFWIFHVVPGIEDMFVQMQLTLPPITVWMLSAFNFIESYAIGIVIAAMLVFAFLYYLVQTNYKSRLLWHKVKLRTPVVGKISQASGLAFIAEYFSLFAASGIDILRSLKTLEGTVTNEVYREKIIGIREGLERGSSLSKEFQYAEVFPSFVVRMISIGEQSGTLAEQLQYIADEYSRRLHNIVENIGEIIKPLAMLVVGGFFILIVVGLFLPIYQLIGQVGVGK